LKVVLTSPTGGATLGIASTASVTLFDNEGTVQNFDTAGAGTPFVPFQVAPLTTAPELMEGGPSGVGNFIRLVSDAPQPGPPSSNTLTFGQAELGAFGLVVADFNFRITPGVGRGDGFGFTLLNNASYPGPTAQPELPPFVAEEPHYTDSLGIGFDVHQSPDLGDIGNGNIRPLYSNSLSVHFGGALVTNGQFDVTPVVDLAGARWIHARVIVRTADTPPNVSVILTPNGEESFTVIDRFAVPGLTPYESRVHFGGRAGGETAAIDLDDIVVRSSIRGKAFCLATHYAAWKVGRWECSR
jgi:hypothetical protein